MDETYVGEKHRYKGTRPGPRGRKESVVAMVERGGQARASHMTEIRGANLKAAEFRYNTRGVDDGERTRRAIMGAEGKRLTYRPVTG